jgi:hypothetical protein
MRPSGGLFDEQEPDDSYIVSEDNDDAYVIGYECVRPWRSIDRYVLSVIIVTISS